MKTRVHPDKMAKSAALERQDGLARFVRSGTGSPYDVSAGLGDRLSPGRRCCGQRHRVSHRGFEPVPGSGFPELFGRKAGLPDKDDAAWMSRSMPRLGKFLARGNLSPTDGVTKLTPGQKPSHTTWWPSCECVRLDLFHDVEEVF